MNKQFKRTIGALAAVATFLLVGAAKCTGPEAQPNTYLILDISGPPLAQTLGCGNGQWYISILKREIADDETKSVDDKVKLKSKECVSADVAKKYTVNGYYP